MNFNEYTWIVVVGALGAFFAAYGIGANDVSNAFGSSVGSRALTLGQAVIFAAIFEFGGTVLVGSQVTDTIRKNIIDIDIFIDDPEILMYGMLCVVFSVGFWLFLATYLELPVSTTHSTIGAIIGIGLVHSGTDGIVWAEIDDNEQFLSRFKGVLPIITSWIISPILSGFVGAFVYWFSRTFVLRSTNALKRSYIYFPILVVITVAVNIYFIIYKGFKRKINGKKLEEHLQNDVYISLLAWGIGILVGIIIYFTVVKWLKETHNTVEQDNNQLSNDNEKHKTNDKIIKINETINDDFEDISLDDDDEKKEDEIEQTKNIKDKKQYINILKYTGLPFIYKKLLIFWDERMSMDLHKEALEEQTIGDIHNNAEIFSDKSEETFKYVQIFTAAMGAWGHGANDSANALGPFAAIWSIYKASGIESKADVPIWIMVLGGTGIVLGLATYGYKIIKVLGIQLTKITPSRGYAIEMGSAIIIILGSIYGIPLSTTFCQTGSTVGVGLLDGKASINKKLLLRIFIGWIMTLIVAGGTAALLFSFGIYSPSTRCNIYKYEL